MDTLRSPAGGSAVPGGSGGDGSSRRTILRVKRKRDESPLETLVVEFSKQNKHQKTFLDEFACLLSDPSEPFLDVLPSANVQVEAEREPSTPPTPRTTPTLARVGGTAVGAGAGGGNVVGKRRFYRRLGTIGDKRVNVKSLSSHLTREQQRINEDKLGREKRIRQLRSVTSTATMESTSSSTTRSGHDQGAASPSSDSAVHIVDLVLDASTSGIPLSPSLSRRPPSSSSPSTSSSSSPAVPAAMSTPIPTIITTPSSSSSYSSSSVAPPTLSSSSPSSVPPSECSPDIPSTTASALTCNFVPLTREVMLTKDANGDGNEGNGDFVYDYYVLEGDDDVDETLHTHVRLSNDDLGMLSTDKNYFEGVGDEDYDSEDSNHEFHSKHEYPDEEENADEGMEDGEDGDNENMVWREQGLFVDHTGYNGGERPRLGKGKAGRTGSKLGLGELVGGGGGSDGGGGGDLMSGDGKGDVFESLFRLEQMEAQGQSNGFGSDDDFDVDDGDEDGFGRGW